MVSNQEQIDSLIKGFVDSEKSRGKTSSTRIRNLTTKEGDRLDALTRVLANKGKPQDTCVALFVMSSSQLLVASNLEEPEYAKGYLKDLKEYIEAFSTYSHNIAYEKLVRRAVQQIFHFIVANESREKSGLRLETLEEFKSLVVEGKKGNGVLSKLKEIGQKKKEVFQEFERKKIGGSWLGEYILPLIDTDEIANDIRDELFDQRVIEAIKGRRICYIRDKLNMHAEMKILNKLYNRSTRTFSEVGYIGITKLCCFPCQTMINLVNSKMSNSFSNCGTHASTYFGGVVPDFYQDEFIETLKLSKKGESSSKIPKMLPRSSYGEFQRDGVSIHRSFRNQEIKNHGSEYFSGSEAKSGFGLLGFSPEKDLGLALGVRDEKKLDVSDIVSKKLRLVNLRSEYQQSGLVQEFECKMQISPK